MLDKFLNIRIKWLLSYFVISNEVWKKDSPRLAEVYDDFATKFQI